MNLITRATILNRFIVEITHIWIHSKNVKYIFQISKISNSMEEKELFHWSIFATLMDVQQIKIFNILILNWDIRQHLISLQQYLVSVIKLIHQVLLLLGQTWALIYKAQEVWIAITKFGTTTILIPKKFSWQVQRMESLYIKHLGNNSFIIKEQLIILRFNPIINLESGQYLPIYPLFMMFLNSQLLFSEGLRQIKLRSMLNFKCSL